MNIYVIFFVLITLREFGYGIGIGDECKPVNIMINRRESYNCCLDEGITCKNDHIIKMYEFIRK